MWKEKTDGQILLSFTLFQLSRKINESSSVDMCTDHPKGAINSASWPSCLIS